MCDVWQDAVISIVCALYGFMLIPQVLDSLKGKTVNSITAGLIMSGTYIICVAFATLGLWISAVSDFFVGTMWLLLLILSIKKRRR